MRIQKTPVAGFVPFEYRVTGRANNSFLTESRIVRFTKGLPQVPAIQERKQVVVADADPVSAKLRRGGFCFIPRIPKSTRRLPHRDN